jgi:hypothetical protein
MMMETAPDKKSHSKKAIQTWVFSFQICLTIELYKISRKCGLSNLPGLARRLGASTARWNVEYKMTPRAK